MLFVRVDGYCEIGVGCYDCHLIKSQDQCYIEGQNVANFYCEERSETVYFAKDSYFRCIDMRWVVEECPENDIFNITTNSCTEDSKKLFKRSHPSGRSSSVGDICQFNTECGSGAFCSNGGICNCLMDYIAISGYCYNKANPGESCVEDKQCNAVWPDARCTSTGLCECPEGKIPSRTRDGTVCINSGVPPSCPFPESSNEEPNPATLLANSKNHPLNAGTYMPILCTSTSTEVFKSNHGDGSTWCVYPDGDKDLYIADIYDCLAHPHVTHALFPEYAHSVDGICCPSRSYLCTSKMEQGNEPSVPRWYYNHITGVCQSFLYDPTTTENVSPNNFKSIEHCQSTCAINQCKVGAKQYQDSKQSLLEDTPLGNCLQKPNVCSNDFECTMIGSGNFCCPKREFLCGPMGGRPHFVMPLEGYDKGVAIHGSKPSTRYYFDSKKNKCIPMSINGGLTNFNNFLSKSDCDMMCSEKLICEFGKPLQAGGDNWQSCETQKDCPSTHSCELNNKVCCQTAQSICTQPKLSVGDCSNSVRKYWYNSRNRVCEMFVGGCQFNDNSFDTLFDCQKACSNIVIEPICKQGKALKDGNNNYFSCSTKSSEQCPNNFECTFDGNTYGCCEKKQYTCSLPPNQGIACGGGTSYRYYFNPKKQICENSLAYLGCDGNSNNFHTLAECNEYCGIGCAYGGQPFKDPSSNQLFACSPVSKCPEEYECMNGRCCYTRKHICTQPPVQSTQCGRMISQKYYFNVVLKQCTPLNSGCSKLNSFSSIQECSIFCSSAACDAGEIAYKDISSKKSYECSPSLLHSCPKDFNCKFNPIMDVSNCCGVPNSDICPANEKPFILADDSYKECSVNIATSCPENYLCRFNQKRMKYYCCKSRSGNICPDNRALYRSTRTLLPTVCSIGSQNDCPEKYSCQTTVKHSIQGWCCSSQSICKNDQEFLLDEKTQMPRLCSIGHLNCPGGYKCYKNYCCKSDASNNYVTEGCPPGEFAYAKNKKVIECDPFNSDCPSLFTCQFAPTFQRYQCCGKEPIEEDEPNAVENGCPNSQVAQLNPMSKAPELCSSSGPNTCNAGYICTFTSNGQFQCCAHKAGCPEESVAYIDMSGGAKECKMNADQCPNGYICKKTVNKAKSVCCTLSEKDTITTTVKAIPRQTNAPTTLPTKSVLMTSSTKATPVETTNRTLSLPTRFHKLTRSEQIKKLMVNATLPPLPPLKRKTKKCLITETVKNNKCASRLIGDKCQQSIQCPKTSECISKVCSCLAGFNEKSGICVDKDTKENDYLEYEVEYEDEETNCKSSEIKLGNKCYRKDKNNHSTVTKNIYIISSIAHLNLISISELTENVTDHEKAFLAHLDMSSEPSAISKLQLKMKDLRRALQQKLMGLPCKCEQRLQDLQMVKAFTMESLFEFNSGFKALFRNATKMIGNHSGINPKNFQKHMLILERCIQLFENIGSKIVKIMEYSGNIFTAQLIYARTEELLDAIEVILAETGRVDRHELPDVIVRNSKLMGEALNQFSISIAGL
uniref:Kunitz/Bovine pancreatic trypsin inhibitor domain protein n=1 Tax=Rhabditophanes sp. KR3021 TaxID=114890 RepID=A0AC35TY89_9BILA